MEKKLQIAIDLLDFDKVIERTTGKTGDADIHKP